jgi:predicted phage-related endonuclease
MELELKKLTQDREGAKDQDGTVLYTWKTQESTRIDTTALKKAMPEVAEQFQKTSSTRVLRVKDQKEEA